MMIIMMVILLLLRGCSMAELFNVSLQNEIWPEDRRKRHNVKFRHGTHKFDLIKLANAALFWGSGLLTSCR